MNGKRYGLAMGLTLVVLVTWVAWASTSAHREAASAPTYTSYASGEFFFPPYPSDADRMGFGKTSSHDTTALHAGWYVDWAANPNPPHPGGVEYARTIYLSIHDTGSICGDRSAPAWQRSQVAESITGTALIDNLRANPGALWLIGNEPDSIYNGSPIMPELYTELYHEFYTFIKAHDPSARVAIGAIVQPSPLRLAYLDKVLNRYQSLHGVKLPTALWNIHLYAFREVACDYGAGTPPGASGNGWPYEWWLWSDADLAAQHLRDMRQWMADRGERDKPLIVTEFGQLMPDDGSWCYGSPLVCITQETSRTTLQNDINYFLTATDAQIGYRADGNRLIQLWAWYSLNDYPRYGGDLVNLDGTLTPAGQAFAQIASARLVPYVDLYPVWMDTSSVVVDDSDLVTLTVVAQVDNHGNQMVQSVPVQFTQHNYSTGQLLSASMITASQVLTRYSGIQPLVRHQMQVVPGSLYTLTFEIDPAQTITQARRSAQQMTFVAQPPDLAITLLECDYAGVFYWEQPLSATITATVRNVGYTTSTASLMQLSASITGGTAYLGQAVAVPALAPGAFLQVAGTQAIPSLGAYVITATVQPGGPDEYAHNDIAALNLLATAPDLAIVSLATSERVVYYEGTPLTQTITATLRNLGAVAAFPAQLAWSASLAQPGTAHWGSAQPVMALAPNASVELTRTWVITAPGAHVVTATVQYGHVELDARNNTATLGVLAASHRAYLPLTLRASP